MKQEKSTYTKAEITQSLGVQDYIITVWEKQFGIQTEFLDGQLLYSSEDLEKLKSIKELLYEKGYTIDAAKQYVRENSHILDTPMIAASPLLFVSKQEPKNTVLNDTLKQQLIEVQQHLIRLRNLL